MQWGRTRVKQILTLMPQMYRCGCPRYSSCSLNMYSCAISALYPLLFTLKVLKTTPP